MINMSKIPNRKVDAEYGLELQIPKDIENMQLPNSTLLQFYKALKDRTFWLIGPVDDTLYDLIQYIVDWNKEDMGKPAEERKPIHLIIASGGGSLEVQKTLCAVIEMSTTPIVGVAIGMCASAASMIYLSCHKRLATKNVTFIILQGSCSNLEGTYQQINSFMENYRKDIQEMSSFYKTHTNYDPNVIDSKLDNGDWYIDGTEAVKNGVCHKILTNLDEIWN